MTVCLKEKKKKRLSHSADTFEAWFFSLLLDSLAVLIPWKPIPSTMPINLDKYNTELIIRAQFLFVLRAFLHGKIDEHNCSKKIYTGMALLM